MGTFTVAADMNFDMNTKETWLNNNVLVVGTSGSGKTRTVVEPNLLKAEGSYVVSDPKGLLYKKYGDYLRLRGYRVEVVDFTHPDCGSNYSPFAFVRNETDVIKLSHLLVGEVENGRVDPFWDHSSEVLVSALISYMVTCKKERDRNLRTLLDLVGLCYRRDTGISDMDIIMKKVENDKPGCFTARQYNKVRLSPSKTFNSILATVESKLGIFDCDSLASMLSTNEIDISELCSTFRNETRRTLPGTFALFVIVSDTDRCMDRLANIFFSQILQEMVRFADEFGTDGSLNVPVRFFLDDFATNVAIDNFPRMISSIRSRNMSVALMVQAESQLEALYGRDAQTIVGNCDTYVYLGGNDVQTARAVSERANLPLSRVLELPTDQCIVFRRGTKPVITKKYEKTEEKEVFSE